MITVKCNNQVFVSKPIIFSGGEIHTNLQLPQAEVYEVNAIIKNSDDVMELLLVSDILSRQPNHPKKILNIPYFPYARQDRVCSPGDPFSLKVFVRLLENCCFNEINCEDIHSSVAINQDFMFSRLKSKPMVELVCEFGSLFARVNGELAQNSVVFVAPDKGAKEKVAKVANIWDVVLLTADKKRDTSTGKIISYSLNSSVDIKNSAAFIFDDICDGGATFITLGKILKEELNVDKVILYVSHGIFSKGFTELQKYIDEIYINNYIGKDKTLPSQVYTHNV